MKKRHLLFLLALLLNIAAHAENIAQAIWTEGNTTLTFLSSENLYAQGDDFNGQTVTNVWSGEDVTNSPTWTDPKWYSSVRSSLTTVVFDESFKDVKPQSTAFWFNGCSKLQSIEGIENLNTENVTSMVGMFSGCRGLTSLDVSGFNTQNVTSMDSMFSGCSGLTSLDVSGFNTQNVTSMGRMFSGCSGLTALDVSGFNTQNVTYMDYMFYGCSGLTSLDVSGFNTQNVTSMDVMFSGCSGLTSLDLSSFNTQNVTSMEWMFSGCSGLTSLDLSSFNTQNVANMGWMFDYCSGLTSLDLSSFNTQNVTYMYDMFSGCSGLTSLDLSSFNTQNVTNMGDMFSGCSGLTSLDLSSFNTQNVTSMSDMFSNTGSAIIFIPANAKEEILSQRDFNMVLKAEDGSFSCSNFKPAEDIEFDIPYTFTASITINGHMYNSRYVIGWNTKADGTGITYQVGQENATIHKGKTTFYPIYGPAPQIIWTVGNATLTFLKSENLYHRGDDFNGQTVTNVWRGEDVINSSTHFSSMWWNSSVSSSLTTVVFDESFKDVKPQSTASWFSGCSKLQSIEGIENLNTENVTDMSSMFYGCRGLTSLDVSGFNTQNVTDMNSMFSGCSGLTTLDLTGFDTQNVKTMVNIFYGCSGLTSLDMSGFNTQNVTNMDYMFYRCRSLTSLDLGSFNTQNVTSMGYMFSGCSSLTSLDLSSFNTQNVTDMQDMFSGCSGLTTLDVSGFNTQNVTYMRFMFSGCSGLTSLDLSSFNTQNVTHMNSMFYVCSGLTSIDLSGFNTQDVKYMNNMFSGCSGLTTLDLSGFDTKKVHSLGLRDMFKNTGSAIIFIPADTKQNILSQRDFNMVLKAADGSFSCENFVPIDSVELNIPYAFTATLTSEAPQKEGLTFTGWNTMSDGSGTNYVPGQTDAVIEKGLVTFYPIFYDPTNIQMQQAERTGDTRYYNLRGMRMEQPRKGLNITVDKNGRSRKVMMR